MAPLDVLLIVLSSAAGFALMGAGLVVLEGMHPFRSGRWFTSMGWLGTVASGLYLALVPGWTHTPVPWYVAMVAVTAAIVVWQNLDAICDEAKRKAKRPFLVPVIAAGLLAGCMAIAPALGAQLIGKVIHLTDEEAAICSASGCGLISLPSYEKLRDAALKCGRGA